MLEKFDIYSLREMRMPFCIRLVYYFELEEDNMLLDFSKPITGYEFLALLISIVALIIPFAKWIYNNWILKATLRYMPLGCVTLMFNESGSYLRLDGVFEVINKATAIKNIKLNIKRNRDGSNLNLEWEAFISPASQKFCNMYSSVSEVAHPFRIEANSVACGFIEFTDLFNTFFKQYQPIKEDLDKSLEELNFNKFNFNDSELENLKNKYISLPSYDEARKLLEKELFWQLGEYTITLFVKHTYGINEFKYEFTIGKSENELIRYNFNETLRLALKKFLNQPVSYKTVSINIKELNSK